MSTSNYVVLKNETLGRYLVASRNIKAGELIFSEEPSLIGPPIAGLLTCFNCFKEIKRNAYVFCSECNSVLLCNGKCTGKFHTTEECNWFKTKDINGRCIAENNQIIFPLRCLCFKTTNPELWKRFMELESHLKFRRQTAIWRRHKVAVEDILKELNIITEEDIKDELIQKICGILDVNTFEVRPSNCNISITNPERQCLRGLYIQAALMAHDCTGNTLLSVDDDYTLTVKASVDIPENSPILFNYANALQGSIDRRQHLREGKYFECFCKRCNDPLELNTNISSLKCHKCPNGFVRSIVVNDPKSDWACSSCGKQFVHSLVNIIIDEARRLIEDIGQINIDAMEKLHLKLLKTFHPNHYLLLELQQNMIGLYSLSSPDINNLKKKINSCQNILRVISVVEPGISRIKAMTLYQLQSAMIDLAHKNFQQKLIPLEGLLLNLRTAEDTLIESIRYLLHEPAKSPEGKIARTGLSELKVLRMTINNIQNDMLTNQSITRNGVKIEDNLSKEENIKKINGNNFKENRSRKTKNQK